MTSALYVQTRKEARALLPWWVTVAAATVVTSYVATRDSGFPNFRYDQSAWLLIVYAAGVLVLAALSVGQELTHGAFASLLVQPVDRRRVLWTKIGVLASVLCSLGLIAEATFPRNFLPLAVALRPLSIWGPVAIGIGLVPLFTLLTRKPLAGPVFAPVLPGLIYVIGERYVFAGGTGALTAAWYGTIAISIAGFAALTFLFPRTQVAGDGEGSPPSRPVPAVTPAASFTATRVSGRPRHWVWQSVLKELRLQQLTMAVSGLFVLLGTVIVFAQRMDPPYLGPGVGALAVLHGVFIALIAGSRASAEERHLGVLAAQALQPRAAWQQWLVKVSATLSLVLVLAIALPWLFSHLHADVIVNRTPQSLSASGSSSAWLGLELEYFAGIALACIAAMYLSSLSSNSLWALLSCVPGTGVILALMAFLLPAFRALNRTIWARIYDVTPAMRENYRDPGWATYFQQLRLFRTVEDYLFAVATVLFALVVVYLAYRNHKSLERGFKRIAMQAGLMAASLTVALAMYVGACHLVWSIIH